MPPLYPVDAFPYTTEPSPFRDLSALPATVDRGFFFKRDAIADACDPGSMPTQGFRPASKSLKDCRLSANSRLTIRSSSAVGVTGGHVEGASDPTVNWGKPKSATRTMRRTGKNARKRAARKSG